MTNTSLVSSLNPSLYTQSVTFTATVTEQVSSNPVTCGTVTFNDGVNPIASGVPLGSPGPDQAAFTTSSLSAGSHSITATYVPGACIDFGSTSPILTQNVFDELQTRPVSAIIFTASIYGGVSGSTTAPSIVTASNMQASGNIVIGTVSVATLTQPAGAMAGPNFAISSDTCSGMTLAPNTSCTVGVTFTASGLSAMNNDFTGTLTIPSNAANSPNVINLSGTGVKSLFSITSAIAFPNTAVGATSAAMLDTVQNLRSVPLVINAIPAPSGSFVLSGTGTCNTVGTTTLAPYLSPGASCTAGVVFQPTAQGTVTGSLGITSNFANGSSPTSLKGTGTLTGLTIVPGSNQFGAVFHGTPSTDKAITVSNPNSAAGGTVAISSITTSNASFLIDNGANGNVSTCGSSLAPSTSCTLYVYFMPATTGSFATTLNIHDNAGNGLQQGTLYGTGN
jgi:hypothetical protein